MPFSILYAKFGTIYQCGPFDTEDQAMKYADDHRQKDTTTINPSGLVCNSQDGDDQDLVVEFDLESDIVFLMDGNHKMVELQDTDFEEINS